MAPVSRTARTSALNADLTEGATAPLGKFDPLGFMELGSDSSNAWMRHAEVKHGRVAMAATVGWMVNEQGFHFPGNLATDLPFEKLAAMKPLDAWDAVPFLGKVQILFFLGSFEIISETTKPHYMKGGKPGVIPYIWDPIGFVKGADESAKSTLRVKELNNGRAAMIAIMSFFAAGQIPGSVPVLPSPF